MIKFRIGITVFVLILLGIVTLGWIGRGAISRRG